MVVGDIVNIKMDGLTSYQPALGVELIVLKTFRWTTALQYIGFQDGITQTATYNTVAVATSNRSADWSRFGITNASYYYNATGSAGTGFSAIQTK